MTTANHIPEGYMEDTMGRLVPKNLVGPLDQLRHELVTKVADQAKETHARLVEFKQNIFEQIRDFVDTSAAEYEVPWGGKKGNISLVSFDGRFKIIVAIAEHMEFDERLQVAKELIDECIHEWAATSSDEIKLLINDAFTVDSKGKLNVRRILSLRKFQISDERWQRAMTAIGDSLTVAGSKEYLRIYERNDRADRWQQITLDLASV